MTVSTVIRMGGVARPSYRGRPSLYERTDQPENSVLRISLTRFWCYPENDTRDLLRKGETVDPGIWVSWTSHTRALHV